MKEKDERTIDLFDENGKKIDEGKILFSIEENGDTYVFYTVEKEIDGEHQNVLISKKTDENGNLIDPEDDEYDLIEKVLNKYIDELSDEEYDELFGNVGFADEEDYDGQDEESEGDEEE